MSEILVASGDVPGEVLWELVRAKEEEKVWRQNPFGNPADQKKLRNLGCVIAQTFFSRGASAISLKSGFLQRNLA